MSDFADPSTSSGIAWADLKGSLLLVKPHEQITGIKTSYGESDAVRADVIVLDGDHEGTEYLGTYIFPKVLQSQLKPRIGQMVLGRLGQGHKKDGQSPPWTLSTATDDEKKVGKAYLDRTAADTPF